MSNELIDRYVYAVVRHLPSRIKNDVSRELDALISDMLTDRCGDIAPADKDIRVVLTELGAPNESSSLYSGHK